MKNGGVASYIAKLHGFDLEVTNSMANSWKDGKVKVNVVSFLITEEVFSTIIEIPMEGFKFYTDKKLSTNAVKDFVKSTKEMNELIKNETFYVTDSIKKL